MRLSCFSCNICSVAIQVSAIIGCDGFQMIVSFRFRGLGMLVPETRGTAILLHFTPKLFLHSISSNLQRSHGSRFPGAVHSSGGAGRLWCIFWKLCDRTVCSFIVICCVGSCRETWVSLLGQVLATSWFSLLRESLH